MVALLFVVVFTLCFVVCLRCLLWLLLCLVARCFADCVGFMLVVAVFPHLLDCGCFVGFVLLVIALLACILL